MRKIIGGARRRFLFSAIAFGFVAGLSLASPAEAEAGGSCYEEILGICSWSPSCDGLCVLHPCSESACHGHSGTSGIRCEE